jgi:streptogramin lyase
LSPITAKVATPDPARYVAVGAGAVWAVSNETPILWRINPARNKIVAAINLTDTPNGLAATPNAVWILGATNNRVVRIDPSKNRERSVISIPKRDGPTPTRSGSQRSRT